MKDQPIIYHNTTCSKCMLATHILEEKGFEPISINYLENPLNREQILKLLALLKLTPENIVRKEDPAFVQNYNGENMKQEDYLSILEKFPELMQRPIVVYKGRAIIARPPQKINELL